MKKILLVAAVLFSISATNSAQAQVNVHVGKPVVKEQWYSRDNSYYYLPEQGVYYNVQRKVYVFPENGQWLYANRLPSRYGSYSYRNSQYVRINDRSPFDRDNEYRQKYYKGNNPKAQGRHDNGNHNGAKVNHSKPTKGKASHGGQREKGRGNGKGHR